MTSFSKGVEYTKVRALLDQNFKKGCYEVLPQTMYPSPFTSGKKSVEKKNGKKQALYITPPLLALRETNHVKHNQPPPEKRQVPKEPAKVFPAISPSYLNSVPKNEGLGHFQRNKEETNRKCRHMFRIAIIAKQDFSSDEHISDESHLLLDVPDWSEEDLNALVEIEKHVCCSRSNFEPQISNSRQLVQNQVPNIQRVETCILETPMEIHDEAKKVAQVQSPKVEPTNERVFESSETPTRQLLSWKLEAAESLLERLNSRLLKSTKMEEAVKLRKDIEDVIHKKNEIIAQMTENNRDSVSYDENTGQTNLYPLESSSSAKVDSHEETSVPTMDNYCVAETRFTQSTCDKPQNNEMLNNNSKSSEMELRSVKNDTTHLEWTGEFPWTYQLKKDNFIYFGNVSFRPNQLESMNAILSNRDVFVLMPTGGGKSLCYQLPALWGPGVTIVVSPLISLITDQVSQLHERGIFAAALTASTTAQVRKSIFDDLRATFPRLRLLYVTPERISKSAMFHKYLTQLYNRNLLARFVIDEAHCVSQWGHDFRPDYTQLKLLKREFRGIPIMALTATATVEVREDIKVQLGIPNCVTFQQSFNRSNLTYYVREKKKNAIQEIAQEIRDKYARQCGIIYCLSQRDCEVLADTLYREYEILAAPYHAGLSDERRQLTHEDWMYGRVHVICATVAFGMGINKGDVRYVYHYSMPKNIEGYYQESGRAGRDGKRSDCILYFSHADRFRLLRMISDSEGSQEQILRNEQGVAKMASYCLNDVECRRQLLLAYFSESFDPVHCNPPCDNCAYTEPAAEIDFTEHALGLVKTCESIQEEIDKGPTAQYLIKVYRGCHSGLKAGHSSLANFGKGKEMKEATCHRLIEDLISCQVFRVHTEIGPYGQVMATLQVNKSSSAYTCLCRGQRRFCLKTRAKNNHGSTKAIEDGGWRRMSSNGGVGEDPIASFPERRSSNDNHKSIATNGETSELMNYLLQCRKDWLQDIALPDKENIPLTCVLTAEEAHRIAKHCPRDMSTLRPLLTRNFALEHFADHILQAVTRYPCRQKKKKRANPNNHATGTSKGKQLRKNIAVKV